MKARQLHVTRLQPENDPRAPLVEIYNLRGASDEDPAPRTIAVVRYGDDLEGNEIVDLLEGVEASLNSGHNREALSTMALDASLAFEVYEIDDQVADDGAPTTALLRAREDYVRLRNLEAARVAGWDARIKGAAAQPPAPFDAVELAARWTEGWTAADTRIEHDVQAGQIESWKNAAFEVCARRAWGALCASVAVAPGESTLAPWPELPEAEQSGWRLHVRGWIDSPIDRPPSTKFAPAFKAARAIAATFRSFNLEL